MRKPQIPFLLKTRESVAIQCTGCGGCRAHCAFLQEHGTPLEIAEKITNLPVEQWPDPFGCSLCGLCSGVCPERVQPDEMFLAMRQEYVRKDMVDFKPYAPVLTYEKLGASKLLSFLRLPEGGDTVLFPGCALPSTRPDTVRSLFGALRDVLPQIGMALGCCLKPSHDLGRDAFFTEQFGRLQTQLVDAGVKRVITACPNCQKIFSRYGGTIEAVTAYEVLADSGFTPVGDGAFGAVIHDPCPQRFEESTQDAVRVLAKRCDISVQQRKHERQLTRCCGEGGMVTCVLPQFADSWTEERVRTMGKDRVVTSCAGCAGFLGKSVQVDHILDLLFDSKPTKALKPPFTYLSRIKLKHWFKKALR